jgi:two-component system, cell cycle sensor histidine kinase and response regulator CckA
VTEHANARRADRTPISGTRKPTVLLVEDDPSLAVVTAEWLRRMHFDVIVCTNGREAQELAMERSAPIDLLFADVMLPGLGGPALAGAIRGRHPEMAVLFSSGYSPELLGEMFSSHMNSARLLHKPYNAAQLATRVQLALGARPAPPVKKPRSGTHSPQV